MHKLQADTRACVVRSRTHTGEPEIIWNHVADAIYIFNDRGYRTRLASEEGNRAEKRDGTRTGTEKSFIKGKEDGDMQRGEKSAEDGTGFRVRLL